MKKSTLRDVAKRTGLTEMTVALALENDKSVPVSTRRKIIKAAKELEFNTETGKVVNRRKSIAVVAGNFYPHFIREIVDGIENTIPEKLYSLTFHSTGRDEVSVEEQFNELLEDGSSDAIISAGLLPPADIIKKIQNKGIPFVLIERECEGVNTLVVDNVQGGYDATEYLISRGCKNILVVAGGPKHSAPQDDRIQGYKEVLEHYKMDFKKENVIYAPHLNFDMGRGVFNKHLRKRTDFDGIFCAGGDMTAIGIMHEAKNAGRAIPDDFSIIGFDNMTPAIFVTPSLTTISQPVKEMGEKAVEIIIELFRKKSKPKRIVFDTHLVVRSSV